MISEWPWINDSELSAISNCLSLLPRPPPHLDVVYPRTHNWASMDYPILGTQRSQMKEAPWCSSEDS